MSASRVKDSKVKGNKAKDSSVKDRRTKERRAKDRRRAPTAPNNNTRRRLVSVSNRVARSVAASRAHSKARSRMAHQVVATRGVSPGAKSSVRGTAFLPRRRQVSRPATRRR